MFNLHLENAFYLHQDGDNTFNRAKLMNIGYAEALKEYDYDCFVFSDVDIIPMDDRNTYKCFSQPRHLSVSMDKFGFKYGTKLNRQLLSNASSSFCLIGTLPQFIL